MNYKNYKNIIYILLLILILLFSIFTLSIGTKLKNIELFTSSQNNENINVDIGNELSNYFYLLGLQILQKKDFEYQTLNTSPTNMSDHLFFKHLPTFIPYGSEQEKIYECFSKHNITFDNYSNQVALSSFELFSDKRYFFWTCMKPFIHQLMESAFVQSGLKQTVDIPVIHFRCADTPFLRYSGYHLQYYSFFIKAIETLSKKTNKQYKTIGLMSCVNHRSNNDEQKSCKDYSDSLYEYLQQNGYEVQMICNSNIDDFTTLFYAPGVISTWSSFSFMSGYFGHGVFVSTEGDKGRLCEECSDFTLYDYNLPHEDVKDYYDTKDVIELLHKK